YTYNESGIRTAKNRNGTVYSYTLDGSKILKETRGASTTLYYYYDDAGSITGFTYNGTNYYYGKNIQGDVKYIYNTSGTVVVEYCYDAWGNIISTTGSLASTVGYFNPFRYRGYYYDIETGFYYLQSRYYDPTVGRFLNADAPELAVMAQYELNGTNLYAYCINDPINYFDSNGGIRNPLLKERVFNYNSQILKSKAIIITKTLSTMRYVQFEYYFYFKDFETAVKFSEGVSYSTTQNFMMMMCGIANPLSSVAVAIISFFASEYRNSTATKIRDMAANDSPILVTIVQCKYGTYITVNKWNGISLDLSTRYQITSNGYLVVQQFITNLIFII
ncbi:MAG: hypothetical protein A2Y17_05575, partial [Clostridiales bacterium GWF2_38_85]